MTAQERAQIEDIWKFLQQQERHRQELRDVDEERHVIVEAWRRGTEDKLDTLVTTLGRMPEMMDAKIAACREERTSVTKTAVQLAAERTLINKILGSAVGRVATIVTIVGGMGGFIFGLVELLK
jgi:hypothetical protein